MENGDVFHGDKFLGAYSIPTEFSGLLPKPPPESIITSADQNHRYDHYKAQGDPYDQFKDPNDHSRLYNQGAGDATTLYQPSCSYGMNNDTCRLSDVSDKYVSDDQAYSMASEHSHYSSQELPYNGSDDMAVEYIRHDNRSEGDISDEELNNPKGRVLKHLDNILRDKVNLEVEEFSNQLQGVLEQHQSHVRHLMAISKPNKSQDSTLDGEEINNTKESGFLNVPCMNCIKASFTDKSVSQQEQEEENEKTRLVLQMMTSLSAISKAIRRKEFQT